MSPRSITLVLTCLGLLFAMPMVRADALEERSAAAEAIRQSARDWTTYYEAGDYDAVAELYTVDTLVMPRNSRPMVGREQVRSSLRKLAGGRKVTAEFTEKELVVAGDIGWVVSDFRITYTSADPAVAPRVDYGHALLIYRKDPDGRWRIHRDIDTPAPAPTPEASAAP
ncbi:MAG: SgcJ/EcaC family oxidoreductase [Sinobacteraceae bacterium]|nr:SgcJ/EcaC family oxidoreductase [Nevskiaceae bacterium]MCP5338681.1 SgcJ/EcaC family oxidoreductase [Nevskiaceae bacterium]MCP5473008.1 SgcJ/EcaC family oxidoreductase [Nevskiaceae bacterium]